MKSKKRIKRIRFLMKLYPAIVKVVLAPVMLLVIRYGKTFVSFNRMIDLIGWHNIQVIYILFLVIVTYLLIFPTYFLVRGMYLFNWELVALFDSLRATFKLRYALFRQPNKSDTDRVIRDFNHVVKRATFSVWDDVIELVIPLPNTVDAQTMLNSQTDAIRQRVSLMFPQYALSSFEQKGMTLVLIGSRH